MKFHKNKFLTTIAAVALIVSRGVVYERCALRGSRRLGPGRSGCHGGQRDGDTIAQRSD